MTTSLAFCANTGVSLIDLPRTEPIDDPQASSKAALQWHSGPDTRSRYWLDRAKTLECNPLTDVKTFENLLDDPVNKPTVTNARGGHHPLPAGAPDPDDGCLADFLMCNKGFIRD
jgi:hypothetical protein